MTPPAPFSILFEDPHCIVVSKPNGLLTQVTDPTQPGESLERSILDHLGSGALEPDSVYLGTVHRLDLVVSGVMIWAKTKRSARRLSRQFETRRAIKIYWAIVHGGPGVSGGIWEDWIGPDLATPGRQAAGPERPGARRAVTRFATIGELGSVESRATRSLLELRPETGRTHQIRVQAAARGWPIVGDTRYGSTLGLPQGIGLHARSLTVRHPQNDNAMTFVADPPDWWSECGFTVPAVLARSGRGEETSGGAQSRTESLGADFHNF